MNPNQFGNSKGVSTPYYLIKLMSIYAHAESCKRLSIVAVTDFTEPFDLIDHNIVCSFLDKIPVSSLEKGTFRIVSKGGIPQGIKFGSLASWHKSTKLFGSLSKTYPLSNRWMK